MWVAMIVLRNRHPKKMPRPLFWLLALVVLGIVLVALTGCTSLEGLCWKANANKTCPSILNVGD